MADFYVGSRPGREVTHRSASFELPILYHRDDCFGLIFSCDLEKAREFMPSERLHPVTLLGVERRAMVGFFAFNYLETSIGPYGEVAVMLPAVHVPEGAPPPPPILPGFPELGPPLFGKQYPGYGYVVMHLPVTKTVARDAGRGEWGYTKFVGDMNFTVTPEHHRCVLGEEGSMILDMKVHKRGTLAKDKRPICTYSVRDGDLIKTLIPTEGIRRNDVIPRRWSFQLGDHEVSESIRQLKLSPRPILARTYVERNAILPSGEIVERGVKPLEGYFGAERQGELVTRYIPE